jgi:hypothetical protein
MKNLNDEIRNKIIEYCNEIEKYNKYIYFKFLDMEKYVSNDENYEPNFYVEEAYFENYNEFILSYREYKNFDMSKQLNGNKEKFLDIEDDYEVYLKIYLNVKNMKLDNLSTEIGRFCDKNKIHAESTIIHKRNEGEDKDLYPISYSGDDQKEWKEIMIEMYNNLQKWEEE